jgi:hypothetical protein
MTAASTLLAGRAKAESHMLDTCTVSRLGPPVTDPVTGVVTTPPTLVYGTLEAPGRCKVQTYEAQESNPEAGGGTLTLQRYRVDVPVARTTADYGPKIGDVVTIATAAVDPHMVGRQYRVVALLHKTLATAYRLGVEEVV